MESSLKASANFGALLAGLGVSGLWFTLPAGIVADKFGPSVTAFVGGVLSAGGYLGFSFAPSKGLLVLSYLIVGVGSGSTFLSSLRTAISLGRTIGISLVSVSMSISITATVQLHTSLSAHVCNDNRDPECWRTYTRWYSALVAGAVAIGGACMWDAHKYVPPVPESRPRASSLTEQLSLLESFRILKKPYFWCLFTANLVGLGSGVYVVNSIFGNTGLWEDYLRGASAPLSANDVVLMFSLFCARACAPFPAPSVLVLCVSVCAFTLALSRFCFLHFAWCAVGNVTAPIICNFLHTRGYLRASRLLGVWLSIQVTFCASILCRGFDCVSVCVHACTRVSVFVSECAHACVCVCACVHACACVCVCVRVSVLVCACVRVCVTLCAPALVQAFFFLCLGVLAATEGSVKHRGGSDSAKSLYGLLLGLTGLGYGSFLAIIPVSLADAYGHENFG